MDLDKLVEGWINLALSDLKVASELNVYSYRGAIVFHLQQCVEKLLKGIIVALGFEPPRTHFPSKKIEEILLEVELEKLSVELSDRCRSLLESIINVAKSLEDEVTRPRYGVRHVDRIVLPDELYSIDTVRMFFDDVKFIIEKAIEVFHELDTCRRNPSMCEKLSEALSYELREED